MYQVRICTQEIIKSNIKWRVALALQADGRRKK